jgi:hypothetical protein
MIALTILPLLTIPTVRTYGLSFNMKYDLGYRGIPFPAGTIFMTSNFTNIGQLTIRVTGISLASDFWSNGTRQVTSGFPFNLTTGMNKEVDTPVLIPTTALVGNHNVTSTATWQYSNSSGWYNPSPVVVSKVVTTSQTIGSLFSSFATILLIGLGVAGVVGVSVVFLATRRWKKPKPSSPLPSGPQTNPRTQSRF